MAVTNICKHGYYLLFNIQLIVLIINYINKNTIEIRKNSLE